jgi:DNA-binding MarR family transcriptional regulator
VPSPRPRARAFDIDPAALPLTHLAHFVGMLANRQLLVGMRAAGFGDLRESHGFLIQHLLRGPHSVSELSGLLGVSQQAASKTVAELAAAGYLESSPGADARVRLVQLSERGHESVLCARKLREKLERRLHKLLGAKRTEQAQRALADVLAELGGVEAVKQRRLPPPDPA